MTTNLIVQLSVIAIDQLSSTVGEYQPSQELEAIYLAQHYRSDPRAMNTIPIPVCADSTPTLPLPTVELKRRYKVLGNHHIFLARHKAHCPFALCLRLNQPEQDPQVWQAELQNRSQPIKFSISTLEENDLAPVFDHLARYEKGLATLLSRKELSQALAQHPGRPYWSSWDPLKALAKSLNVSITKKHTDCLDNYFSFDPQPLPSLCINTASEEEINQRLQMLPLTQKAVDTLSVQLSNSPSRPYWSSWDPLKVLAKSLNVSIAKRQTDCLGNYFSFDPQPLPGLCINTASPEEINQRLQVLSLARKTVDTLSAQLSSSPTRPYWRNSKDTAQAIKLETKSTVPTASQTAITKGFTFAPAPPLVPNTLSFMLQAMTVTALRREATQRGLDHTGLKKPELVQLLSSGSPT